MTDLLPPDNPAIKVSVKPGTAQLLAYYGRTPLSTDAVVRDVWGEEAKGPERIRGALKMLVALGFAETDRYSSQAITWYWKNAQHHRDYQAGLFGNFRAPLQVDADAPIRNSRGQKIAENADELISYREYERDPWGDL
jgi:hypothetical protein